MVDWTSLGYELAGDASDGNQAFKLIDEIKPEVVITDIKMPVCDGVELMQKMKNSHIDSKIIVISGYGEFEYAKAALEAGAVDYLLKPLNMDRMAEILSNIRSELDFKEKEITRNNKILNYSREQIISNIIYGVYKQDDITEQAEELDIHFNSDCYYPLIIKVTNAYENRGSVSKLYADLFKSSIKSLADELFIGQSEVYTVLGVNEEILLILGYEEVEDFLQMAEKLKCIIENAMNISITIFIGHTCKNFFTINESFELLYQMVNSKNEIKVDRKIIKEIMEYIKNHYSEALSLDVLSAISNLHPVYISKVFKSETGINLIDYITEIRMEKAKVLLMDIKLKAYEVCSKVGYTSSKHFSRTFKAYTGMTPSEYREAVN